MNKRVKYNGHTCEITLGAGKIQGKVLFIKELITFESDTLLGLIKEFKTTIDEWPFVLS